MDINYLLRCLPSHFIMFLSNKMELWFILLIGSAATWNIIVGVIHIYSFK